MWQHELNIAKKASIAAGRLLMRLLGRISHITKKSDIDLVTEADFQAEKTILEILRRDFPQDNVLSEESGGSKPLSNRTWIIDPLDGTTNFVHGFPFFAVSIALEVEKKIVLGVVHNPFMSELFEAAEGAGAFLNKTHLQVSTTKSLIEALLATGFPYYIHERPGTVMKIFEKMLVKAQGVRRPGSAAIDMCYVAAGRLDGFWEQDLKPWDTAAASIIVKEAGGRLSDFQGESYTPYQKSIVAANPFIHQAMMDVLSYPHPGPPPSRGRE